MISDRKINSLNSTCQHEYFFEGTEFKTSRPADTTATDKLHHLGLKDEQLDDTDAANV